MHVVEPIFEYYRPEGFTMGSNLIVLFQILLIPRKIVLVLPTGNLVVIKRHASYNLFKA